jgi:hypothetical protein
MDDKTIKFSATVVSGIFNPLFIPSLGFLLVMDRIPGVSYYSTKLKLVLIAIVLFTSCLIPLFYYFLSRFSRKLLNEKIGSNSKLMLYMFVCLSTFLGAQFLGKLPVTGIFRAILLGVCLISVIVLLISIKWNISEHTTAMGGLWGMLIALNFRYGMDIVGTLILVSLIAGIVASSRIFLERHTYKEVYSGFVMGATCMFGFLFII